jgi:hypothetical protein
LKVTVPVVTGLPPLVTVAVNVTGDPASADSSDEASTVAEVVTGVLLMTKLQGLSPMALVAFTRK